MSAVRPRWSNALFVAPFLFFYLTLLIWPLLAGMALSLFKADLFGGRAFVGFENFARLMRDRVFLQAVANTFYFVLLSVPPLTELPLFLALLLTKGGRLAAFFRGVFFSSSVLSVTIVTLIWRMILMPDGGFIAGTIIKPKLVLRPEPFAEAAHAFWLGGDFIKNYEPQGNQVFSALKKTIPLVYDAMKRAMDATGAAKLFSMNITADDHHEMLARADFALETFGPDANKLAFLVDGYVGGPGMVTTARRNYPNQFLHYHRAGHGAVTSPSAKRGYTAFVLAKMARLQGASGIHVGTMGYGKMEGGTDDRAIAYMIERDEAQGPVYLQRWAGIKATTPIISGGMNALRLPGFFANLGHGNLISTAGGGAYGHLDGPAAGALSLRQAYEGWKAGADPVEWASTHRELARAFESFPGDADSLFPGWRERLLHG